MNNSVSPSVSGSTLLCGDSRYNIKYVLHFTNVHFQFIEG
jgi:hypothetical protein